MNATKSPLRGLSWKEARQIVPLVLMLLGVAILLIVLWSLMDAPSTLAQYGHYIPLLLPALFAAGAGAILVGQEKETRTMLWCSSLPIPPSTMVVVKLVVALIALTVMWIGCVLMGALIGSNDLPGHQAGFPNTLYWIAHSVFILCCGFYTAWRMKNTFASLVALIPLAALPYLLTSVFYSFFGSGRVVSLEESVWVLTGVSTVGLLIMGWLGYRAGINALLPDPPELEATGPRSWLAAWRPANSMPVPETPFRYPLSSLVWQSIHHNRLTLSLLAIAILLGSAAFAHIMVDSDDGAVTTALALVTIVGAVATSWLGVFVFHGDGSASRLRFLADRGVSPTRVWLGRQLVGLSVISVAMMIFLLCCYLSLRGAPERRVIFVPSAALVGLLLGLIYAVSQATSQWIRILAASAFVAPVLSGVAVVWLFSSAMVYQAPFWLVLLCSVLPMIATLLMMRRFMDDGAKWPIWLSGVVTTVLFFTLPVVPFIADVSTIPGIPSDVRSSLIADSKKIKSDGLANSMMSVTSPLQELRADQNASETKVTKIVESQRFRPQDYLSIGDLSADRKWPLHADLGILSQAAEFANHFRYLTTQNPGDSEAVESLGKWVDAMTSIARSLRLSDRWVDQEVADQVEIWLTETLSREQLKSLRSRDFSQRAIAVIADQESRSEARRRAVLSSWWRQQDAAKLPKNTPEVDANFGGFQDDNWFSWLPQQKIYWTRDRLIDRLTVDALELIKAAGSGQDLLPIRRKLHHLMVGPFVTFADGPYELRTHPIEASFGYRPTNFPAATWYGKWEDQAKQLADQE